MLPSCTTNPCYHAMCVLSRLGIIYHRMADLFMVEVNTQGFLTFSLQKFVSRKHESLKHVEVNVLLKNIFYLMFE